MEVCIALLSVFIIKHIFVYMECGHILIVYLILFCLILMLSQGFDSASGWQLARIPLASFGLEVCSISDSLFNIQKDKRKSNLLFDRHCSMSPGSSSRSTSLTFGPAQLPILRLCSSIKFVLLVCFLLFCSLFSSLSLSSPFSLTSITHMFSAAFGASTNQVTSAQIGVAPPNSQVNYLYSFTFNKHHHRFRLIDIYSYFPVYIYIYI